MLLVHDPEVFRQWFGLEKGHDTVEEGQNGGLVLTGWPENDKAKIVVRRIGADVTEIGIERNQGALLIPADGCDVLIGGPLMF